MGGCHISTLTERLLGFSSATTFHPTAFEPGLGQDDKAWSQTTEAQFSVRGAKYILHHILGVGRWGGVRRASTGVERERNRQRDAERAMVGDVSQHNLPHVWNHSNSYSTHKKKTKKKNIMCKCYSMCTYRHYALT